MSEEESRAELSKAILDHVSDEEGQIITKWVLVAEVSDVNGVRWISTRAGTFDNDSPQIWDGIGLLDCGLHTFREQYRHYDSQMFDYGDEPEDDDE